MYTSHNNDIVTQETLRARTKVARSVAVDRITDLFRNREVPVSNLGLEIDFFHIFLSLSSQISS
jgi:hypothetical protein